MSENVDFVRSIYAAWERGDYSSAEWPHPEIEYVIADGPAPGTWTGLAGMADALRDFLISWEDVRLVVGECRELDGGRVLAFHHGSGRGKTSGVEMRRLGAEGTYLFHICDGKVTRLVGYFDRDRALADLGLEE